MKNSNLHLVYSVFILGTAFVLCGFTSQKLADIETAIIKEEFTQAQQLAKDFLNGTVSPPEANEARYYLGLSLLRQNQFLPARDIFSELGKEKIGDQLHDKVNLGLFDTFYIAEEYEKALKVGKKMLKQSPRSAFLSLMYLKMARVDLKLAQWEEAAYYLKKIINEFPDSLELHIARQLLEEKQYFAVQVGAFMDRERAEQLVNQLKQTDNYVYIVETTDQDNTKFYRVRVGQMALLNDAQKLKTQLASQGYPAQIYP